MRKEYLYACLCVFLITLSICVTVVTITFHERMRSPIATIKNGTMITYEVPVETPYQAARIYWRLNSEWEEAMSDENKMQEQIRKAQRELKEYDD